MKKLNFTTLNENKKEQVLEYILNFLDGYDLPELVLSDEKSLITKVNEEGNFELALVGVFIPQDAIKNQLAKTDVTLTTLLEYTPSMEHLIIGTHKRIDPIFNEIKQIMQTKISWNTFKKFKELSVTEHDFFGKGFIVASLNYPINKFNRTALNN